MLRTVRHHRVRRRIFPAATSWFSTPADNVRKPRVLVVAGCTGMGKSEICNRVVDRLRADGRDAEVICADSVHVYRGLNIGSSKPSPQDQARVKHHLIDTRNPSEMITAGDWAREAAACIEEIAGRGNVPILLGGTGFYLKFLLHGIPDSVATTAENEEAVEKILDAEESQWEPCLARLAAVDPKYAASLGRNDWYRLRRALIVVTASGKPMAEHLPVADCPYDFRMMFLYADRVELNRVLDRRCEEMIRDGLVEEVIDLVRDGFSPRSPPGRAIGYRQTLEYLEKLLKRPHASSNEQWKLFERYLRDLQAATRQLAKLQARFFRREPGVVHVRVDSAETRENAVNIALRSLDATRDDFLESIVPKCSPPPPAVEKGSPKDGELRTYRPAMTMFRKLSDVDYFVHKYLRHANITS